jgi:hypothetical protein
MTHFAQSPPMLPATAHRISDKINPKVEFSTSPCNENIFEGAKQTNASQTARGAAAPTILYLRRTIRPAIKPTIAIGKNAMTIANAVNKRPFNVSICLFPSIKAVALSRHKADLRNSIYHLLDIRAIGRRIDNFIMVYRSVDIVGSG